MIVFLDGFADYGPGQSLLSQGGYVSAEGGSVVLGAGRLGQPGAVFKSSYDRSGLRYRFAGGSKTTVGFGIAYKVSALPHSDSSMGVFQANGTYYNTTVPVRWPILTITLRPTGALEIRAALSRTQDGGDRGDVAEATKAGLIMPEAFSYISGAFDLMNTGVAWRVDVDGVRVLEGAVIYRTDVPGPPATQATDVHLGGFIGVTQAGSFLALTTLSDLAVTADAPLRSAPLSDARLWTARPNADGPEQDWAVSGAPTAFEALSSVPPADASKFAVASDPNERLSLGFEALPTNIATISAVEVRGRLWSSSSAGVKVATQVRSGASETAHDSHDLKARPSWYGSVTEADPATASAWDIAAVNAAEIIIDRTA